MVGSERMARQRLPARLDDRSRPDSSASVDPTHHQEAATGTSRWRPPPRTPGNRIRSSVRGAAYRPRSARLWLPDENGAVAPAAPGAVIGAERPGAVAALA